MFLTLNFIHIFNKTHFYSIVYSNMNAQGFTLYDIKKYINDYHDEAKSQIDIAFQSMLLPLEKKLFTINDETKPAYEVNEPADLHTVFKLKKKIESIYKNY